MYKTGVQTVERDGDQYFVTIKNRRYQSEQPVPIEAARKYYRAMSEDLRVRPKPHPLDYVA